MPANPRAITRYHAAAILDAQGQTTSPGVLDVDQASGLILYAGPPQGAPTHFAQDTLTEHTLADVALVPGQINAHSHIFQRKLRGRTEYLDPTRQHDDFWSWRALMYQEANTLTPETLHAIALKTYKEMAATGITSVGEFHYVQHQPDGQPYSQDRDLMAKVVIDAARQAGLRITLLRVAYQRAGAGRPAEPLQRRFIDADVEQVFDSVLNLKRAYAEDTAVNVGIAPHSVRAVERRWLEQTAAFAAQEQVPVHIHACEQRAELSQCIAEHGMPPLELLHECGLMALGRGLTLVHATHLSPRDVTMLAQHKPVICACPSTERNLGDGFLPALQLLNHRVPICVGSDSHANIDPWDELRLIEYHERLRYERRNVLASALPAWLDATAQPSPAQLSTARLLWDVGTIHGSSALGTRTGRLEAGFAADFVAVDLNHYSIADTPPEHLLDALVFGLKPGAIQGAWVNGARTSA